MATRKRASEGRDKFTYEAEDTLKIVTPSAKEPSAKEPSAKEPSAKEPSAKEPSAKEALLEGIEELKKTARRLLR